MTALHCTTPLRFLSAHVFSGKPAENWVIDGQHKVAALKELRAMMERRGEIPPEWVMKVRSTRLKPATSLEDRQRIAGREQARASAVLDVSLSGKLEWLLRHLESFKSTVEAAVQEGLRPRKSTGKQCCAMCG